MGTVKVERLGMKMREGRLRWYGHVMRRVCRTKDYGNGVTGKEEKRETKRRYVDVMKKDMGEVGAKEMDVEDRKVWRMMIHCGHP